MTRFPPFLGPGWLLAYAAAAVVWMAIFGVTPIAVIVVFAALGLLGIVAFGNLISTGHAVPPEDDR